MKNNEEKTGLVEQENRDIIFSKEAVVFVLDVSGSMSGSKIETLKKCFREFLNKKMQVVSRDQVAVVVFPNPKGGFGDSADVVSSLSTDYLGMADIIDVLRATGGTPLKAGMELAAKELDKTDLSLVRMVIMTDGEPTDNRVYNSKEEEEDDGLFEDFDDDSPSRGEDNEIYVRLAAQLFVEKGIIVDTVSIGRSANQTLLERIAASAGGRFTKVDTVGDFSAMLSMVERERRQILGDGIRLLPEGTK